MIHAPLCRLCAKMLRASWMRVLETGGITNAETCPWCERRRAECWYRIETQEIR